MVSLVELSSVPAAVLPAASVALIVAVMAPSARPDKSTAVVPLPSPPTTTGVPPPLELNVTVALASLSRPETV